MLEYPARVKVLAKTRMWDCREGAHFTRGIVRLSTARADVGAWRATLAMPISCLWITAP